MVEASYTLTGMNARSRDFWLFQAIFWLIAGSLLFISGATQMPDSEVDAYIPIHVARERFGDTTVERAAGSTVRERVELVYE